MSEKRSYWELLRDPRWQRKRLEIMERAGFACENCGAEDQTLNVHHGYYVKGAAPWDYPNESLHCLCEPCHERVTALHGRINRALGSLGLGVGLLEIIVGYVEAVGLVADVACKPTSEVSARRIEPETRYMVGGALDYLPQFRRPEWDGLDMPERLTITVEQVKAVCFPPPPWVASRWPREAAKEPLAGTLELIGL